MTYILHTDPGHGWLAVPLADIPAANVEWISECSYWDPKTQTVYLEEDCDIRLAPGVKEEGLRLTLPPYREAYADPCFVRRLPHWPAQRSYEERMTRLGFRGVA